VLWQNISFNFFGAGIVGLLKLEMRVRSGIKRHGVKILKRQNQQRQRIGR